MRFHFGIVNYNGGEHLHACVRSILAQRPDVRVSVFDNASSDDSVARVESEFPRVTVIRSPANLGYAGALNRLLERMPEEVVVLCNMDLEFDPGWMGAMEAALGRQPDADGAASLVLEMTQPPVINSVGVRFFADLHAQNAGSGLSWSSERAAQEAERAFGAYGAVMCFRRPALEDIAFDDDYFLFFEETDFFLRFHLLGHRTVFVPDAVVRHQRSLSTRRFSTLKLYYGERNRLTTVFKLLPVWYWPVAFAATLRRLHVLSRRIGTETAGAAGPGTQAPLPARATIIATLLRAWRDAVLRLPSTWDKRRAFLRRSGGGARAALRLVRRYSLPASELRLR